MKINFIPRLRFPQVSSKKTTVTFEGGMVSSDSGLILLESAANQMGIFEVMADCINDSRDSRKIHHHIKEMLKQRILAIASGYEDANDHNTLKSDPLLKMTSGRLPGDNDLASQPTLSRFENQVSVFELFQMGKSMARQVINTLPGDCQQVLLDIDATNDATYGNQQGSLFNGYYEENCFCPLYLHLTDDHGRQYLLGGLLRRGNATLQGVNYLIKTAVKLLRERFPDLKIIVRGDAAYGSNKVFKRCESLNIEYIFRFTNNVALKHLTAEKKQLLFEKNDSKHDRYDDFYYRARNWQIERRGLVKYVIEKEVINQYFFITNIPSLSAQDLICFYHRRGEQENRIKEIKCDLQSGRTSCHRFEANQFRLLMHCGANIIWNNIQHALALLMPTSSFAKAQIKTLQRHLIKVGARIIERRKHIWLHLPSAYPHQRVWQILYQHYSTDFG